MAMKPESSSKTNGVIGAGYRDYASKDMQASMESENPVHAPGPGGDPPFPVKLHHALKGLQMDNKDDIVGWQSHGRCFIVRNAKLFAEQVLPLYFRQSKFQSFQRQLNLYGFKRFSQGPDKGGYYHELFLRGMPELAARIIRTTVKNKGPRKAASPSTEPNLYSYPPLPATTVAASVPTQAPPQELQPKPALDRLVQKEPFQVAGLISPGTPFNKTPRLVSPGTCTPFTQTSALPASLALRGLPAVAPPPLGLPKRSISAAATPSVSAFFPPSNPTGPSTGPDTLSLQAMSGLIAHSDASIQAQLHLPPRPPVVGTSAAALASAGITASAIATAVLGLTLPLSLTKKSTSSNQP